MRSGEKKLCRWGIWGEKGIVRRSFLIFFLFAFLRPAFAGLEWETTFHEVRLEPAEKSVTVVFPFRNTGAEALRIAGIQTSCGCTSAKVDCKEVPAGGKGSVEVRFDIGNRKGEQVKGVIVRTSDREKHKLVLRVFLPGR